MRSKFLTIILVTLLLLGTIYANAVQASDGEVLSDIPYVQTPVQTIVQIAVTAIVLRILNKFDLP